MTKRNLFVRILIFVVLLSVIMPSFINRVVNESTNNDVVFALNINNAQMNLSEEEMASTLDRNREMGVTTAIIAEESINSLINGGYVTAIKYNVLCHKYDDESEEIVKELYDNDKIHNDSYVLISKRGVWKQYLAKWVSAKYTADEYTKLQTSYNADVYVIYKGVSDEWHIPIGFDEQKIADAKENGYEIALALMLGAYTNTDYIEEIAKLVDKYDVRYINLKKMYADESKNENAKKNYMAFCDMIEKKNLYLVLTEEQTHLSNQKPIGYQELIDSSCGRVLRGYETIDVDSKNKGETIYYKRYSQIVNSVIDRNIRFISLNQIVNGTDTIQEKSEKTNLATDMAIEKLNSIGYNTDTYDTVYNDYNTNRTLISIMAMLIMILMGLTMLEWLFKKRLVKIEILALIGGILSVGFTYFAPEGIVLLYPTLFAALSPCFVITMLMVYLKYAQKKLNTALYIVSAAALSLGAMLICGIIQCALLSGLDYYLNSLIFKGIKISLIIPILYSMVAYGIIFNDSQESFAKKAISLLNANIKVYWAALAVVLGGVAAIYLVRSGNVESISPIESLMRDTITEFMPQRPRTKEFLIGWPCLILMAYYVKNTNNVVLRWIFGVGASILFASTINSFCHVFTSAGTIYMRSINGAILGIVISLIALIINGIIIRVVKKYFKAGK